jgi:hypothetical protein
MKSKDQFLQAYDAGKEAYRSDAEKRSFWDRLFFWPVLIFSLLGTESLFAHHSSLASGWRFAVSIIVPCMLGVPLSMSLEWLRKVTRR